MQVALALPGLPSDVVELELLRAGHRIAWRAASHDELLARLGEVVPDVVLLADDPAVATTEAVGACDLLGVRACLVRADDASSATARLLGVHDILRVVPGRPLDLSVLLPAFDALDGRISDADGAHPGFGGGVPPAMSAPIEGPDARPASPAPRGDADAPSAPRAPHRIDPLSPPAPVESDRRRGRATDRPARPWPWARRSAEPSHPADPPAAATSAPVVLPPASSEAARSAAGHDSAAARDSAAGSDSAAGHDSTIAAGGPAGPALANGPEPAPAPASPPLATPPRQKVIAVWGPAGAPGRSTVAITLAAELAARGHRVCLIDADTYGGTIAPALGLLDEAPGFAAACRLAGSDSLDDGELDRIALTYGGTASPFRVLTGIGRPHRWPELSRDRVVKALEAARLWSDVVVVDTGFNLETDEEVSSDMLAPRRNAATIAALRAADEVVAIGAADPVGLARLLRTHADLLETITTDRVHVVANRVRASVLGIDPGGQVRQTLERFGGIADPVLIADDPSAADAALLSARTVVDVAPRSALRSGVARLADRVGFAVAASPRARGAAGVGGRGLLRRTG